LPSISRGSGWLRKDLSGPSLSPELQRGFRASPLSMMILGQGRLLILTARLYPNPQTVPETPTVKRVSPSDTQKCSVSSHRRELFAMTPSLLFSDSTYLPPTRLRLPDNQGGGRSIHPFRRDCSEIPRLYAAPPTQAKLHDHYPPLSPPFINTNDFTVPIPHRNVVC